MSISPPLETAAVRFIQASEAAAENLAVLIKALRNLSKSKKAPIKFSSRLVNTIFTLEANCLALEKYRDPFSAIALTSTLLNAFDVMHNLNDKTSEIKDLFALKVQDVLMPFVDFTREQGPAVIAANASLLAIYKNPTLAAIGLGMQSFVSGIKVDSTIIDMPANVAYAFEMLQEVTPTLLLLVLCTSVAAIYASAKLDKPSKKTRENYRFAEVGAEFIDAAQRSVKHSEELVEILKIDITKAKRNARLINQAFSLKIAGLVVGKRSDPNSVIMLAREIDPLLQAKDITIAKAAAKVVEPLIDFTTNFAGELSAAAIKVAAIAAHRDLSMLVLAMTPFATNSLDGAKLANNVVTAALTAETIQALNPKLFTLSACAAMYMLYNQKHRLEITGANNNPNKTKN